MASELRRRKGQIRNRLSLHLTGVHEIAQNIPAISELRNVVKKGRLLKLSSRGILYPDAWKKRTCVLTKHKLYIYKTEEQGGRERALAEIDLGVFSHCEETNSKESKKVANSFGLYQKGADHQELGRHLFAAETLTEMSEWVKKIRSSIQAVATESRRRKSCTPSRDDAQVESRSAGDLVFPESGAGPQLPGLTRERVRGPPRRRPSPRSMLETSRSQPSLNEDTDQDQDPARFAWGRDPTIDRALFFSDVLSQSMHAELVGSQARTNERSRSVNVLANIAEESAASRSPTGGSPSSQRRSSSADGDDGSVAQTGAADVPQGTAAGAEPPRLLLTGGQVEGAPCRRLCTLL